LENPLHRKARRKPSPAKAKAGSEELLAVSISISIMASRAVKLKAHGANALEVYQLVTEEKPRASPSHVVVHMTVMPVNPSDLQPAMWTGIDVKDITVGGEGAGVVEEVGEGVTSFTVGQRVIPMMFNRYFQGFGVWRDYVEMSEVDLIAIPEDISDDAAGQFFINPWLAYGILKELNVPNGQWLVHNAAGSTAGRCACVIITFFSYPTVHLTRETGRYI
jgi:NADPH:quinone reductase-like Zn-dependent oxidoreductase